MEDRGIKYGDPEEFREYPGRGVKARVDGAEVIVGKPSFLTSEGIILDRDIDEAIKGYAMEAMTVICIAIDGGVRGIIGLRDRVREDSAETIKLFRRDGIETIMVTGDSILNAEAIAREVGVDRVHGGVEPREKVEIIRGLQRDGYRVAMVGDGINDAPALTQADVGIALATGTDIAIESGDIVIQGGRLSKVYRAREIIRDGYRRVKQNLALAFIFNGIGIPLAALGLIHPSSAMVAMILSVTSILLNTFRGY